MSKIEISELVNEAITSGSDVRLVAQRLMQLGEAGVAPMMEIIYRGNEEQRLAISHYIWLVGEPIVKPLLEALDHSDSQIRRFAAWNLGHLTPFIPKLPVERLLELLDDPDLTTRWSVIWALGRFGDARAVEPIKQHANHSDFDIRQVTAESLWHLATNALSAMSYDEALQQLDSTDQDMKHAAIEVLGRARKPEAVEPLISQLEAAVKLYGGFVNYHHTASLIISALGSIGTTEAIQYLQSLLDHPDGMVTMLVVNQILNSKHPQAEKAIQVILQKPDIFQKMSRQTFHTALSFITSSRNANIFKRLWSEQRSLFDSIALEHIFAWLLDDQFPEIASIFVSDLLSPHFDRRIKGVILYHDFQRYHADAVTDQSYDYYENEIRWQANVSANIIQPLIKALRSEAGKGEARQWLIAALVELGELAVPLVTYHSHDTDADMQEAMHEVLARLKKKPT